MFLFVEYIVEQKEWDRRFGLRKSIPKIEIIKSRLFRKRRLHLKRVSKVFLKKRERFER